MQSGNSYCIARVAVERGSPSMEHLYERMNSSARVNMNEIQGSIRMSGVSEMQRHLYVFMGKR